MPKGDRQSCYEREFHTKNLVELLSQSDLSPKENLIHSAGGSGNPEGQARGGGVDEISRRPAGESGGDFARKKDIVGTSYHRHRKGKSLRPRSGGDDWIWPKGVFNQITVAVAIGVATGIARERDRVRGTRITS